MNPMLKRHIADNQSGIPDSEQMMLHLNSETGQPHKIADCADDTHTLADVIVALDRVCLAYGSHEVLHRLTANFNRGSVTALVGDNGTGKTSLIRILAGLLAPSLGKVCWHGSPSIILCEQTISSELWMPLRVKEIVGMGRYRNAGILRKFSKQDKAIVGEACERLGIAAIMSRQIGELSVGQRRRVCLAMCLASKADILLLDEPEAGLDAISQERILEEIKLEQQRGATVIYATHQEYSSMLADQIINLGKHNTPA